MPIFEYACKSCGRVTEAIQRAADAPLTDCPSCGDQGRGGLTKLLSAHVVGGRTVTARRECVPEACRGCEGAQGGCGVNT